MRRLLHRPSVWYGLLSCLLLTALSLTLPVVPLTAPSSSGQSGLSITVPQLEGKSALILLGTAIVVARHTGRIRVAVGVTLSALIGSWLLTWALVMLPNALGVSALLSAPLAQQTRSITVEQAWLALLNVSFSLAFLGVVVASCGAVLGWGAQRLVRQRLSSVEG
jgi:hypothetical protein